MEAPWETQHVLQAFQFFCAPGFSIFLLISYFSHLNGSSCIFMSHCETCPKAPNTFALTAQTSPKRSPEVLVSVLLCCYAILPFLSIALPDPIWIKTIKTIKTIKSQTSKRCWTSSAIEVSGHDLWHPPHPHHLPTKYCSKCQIGS